MIRHNCVGFSLKGQERENEEILIRILETY